MIFWPELDIQAFEAWHTALRKAGHIVAYGLLAVSWQGAQNQSYRHFTRHSTLVTLLVSLAIACWDEWNQSLLPARTGTPWDVLWDLTGASLFLFCQWLICRVYLHWRDSAAGR